MHRYKVPYQQVNNTVHYLYAVVFTEQVFTEQVLCSDIVHLLKFPLS